MFTAALFNLFPFIGGYWAGIRFPDDINVISLWRILIGIPLFVLWFITVNFVLILCFPLGVIIYSGITILGFLFYYRFIKLFVSVYNNLFCRKLKTKAISFYYSTVNYVKKYI